MKDGVIFVLIIMILVLMFLLWVTKIVSAEEIRWDDLVNAVIEVESGGDPHAVGKAGEIGLMQISPIVLREYNKNMRFTTKYHLFDVWINMEVGTWYLKRLHNHYELESIEEILTAYNWGIGNVRKYGIDKAPKSTKRYIRKVLQCYSGR